MSIYEPQMQAVVSQFCLKNKEKKKLEQQLQQAKTETKKVAKFTKVQTSYLTSIQQSTMKFTSMPGFSMCYDYKSQVYYTLCWQTSG